VSGIFILATIFFFLRRISMRCYVLALATLVGLGLNGAQASISFKYVTDQTAPIVASAAGQVSTVNFYMQETVTAGSTDQIAAEGGIFGMGIFINKSAGDASATLGQINPNATILATPGNQDHFTIAITAASSISRSPTNPNSQGVTVGSDRAGPPTLDFSTSTPTGQGAAANTTPTGPGTFYFYLGSVNVTSGNAGTSTTYALESYKNFTGVDGNTLTWAGTDLDAVSGGAGTNGSSNASTFTITTQAAAVPEPSSMLLCGLAALGMAYTGYRRRNQAQQAVAIA
jgi:hypothetical protein